MAQTAEDEVMDDKSLSESMDEDIRETLKAIQSRNEEPTAEETSEQKPERVRDESGKFAKESAAPAEKPDASNVTEGATETEAADAPLVSTTGQPLDINRAPASWKPAAKAAWGTLPEPIRAEIYRRESDFLNGNKGLRENADFGQQIKGVLEPYRMLIEAEGGTPDRAIADTMRTAALFRVGTPQQKLDAIFQIDKQFNVGLTNVIQQEVNRRLAENGQQPQQAQQPATFADPRVDSILASLQAQERQRAQEMERTSNDAVERFINALGADGQPKHPFVDNVLDDMGNRVAALRRTNPAMDHNTALEQAYEAAVWANPETRAVLLSQQQAAASQPVETLRKVEQARRASAVNVPKRGALPASGPAKTLDETIAETGRALGMF